MRDSYASVKAACTVFDDTYRRLLELYVSTVKTAGVAAIVLPATPQDVFSVHTDVGNVTICRDDRVTKYGATTHIVHMPWKSLAMRVYCKDTKDLREFLHKRLVEALYVELDYY